jgi:hypothetical protein
MRTLRLGEGDPIRITSATLVKGTFVKIQAQEKEFIEVSDPKAVYVSSLTGFITSDWILHSVWKVHSEILRHLLKATSLRFSTTC